MSQCGKIGFTDRSAAVRHRIALTSRKRKWGEPSVGVYKCPDCGRWHCGHEPSKKKRRAG